MRLPYANDSHSTEHPRFRASHFHGTHRKRCEHLALPCGFVPEALARNVGTVEPNEWTWYTFTIVDELVSHAPSFEERFKQHMALHDHSTKKKW